MADKEVRSEPESGERTGTLPLLGSSKGATCGNADGQTDEAREGGRERARTKSVNIRASGLNREIWFQSRHRYSTTTH